jgi:hypothetical protein
MTTQRRAMDEFDKFGFRKVGGEHQENRLAVSVVRKRETKWRHMLQAKNWEYAMTKRRRKVKQRCRKGIPQSLRGLAWQHLSGSHILMNQSPGLYEVDTAWYW